MSVFQRFLTYVGLGPEHEYADAHYGDAPYAHYEQRAQRSQHQQAPAATYNPPGYQDDSADASYGIGDYNARNVSRVLNTGHAEPRVVVPKTFDSTQKIADLFTMNHPVIINLDIKDKKLARRILDFASGICYVLEGSIKRAGGDVFLLTPPNSYLSDEDVATYLRETQNAHYN